MWLFGGDVPALSSAIQTQDDTCYLVSSLNMMMRRRKEQCFVKDDIERQQLGQGRLDTAVKWELTS